MFSRAEQEEFILTWLEKHGGVNALDSEFHDAFYAAFGGTRWPKFWGAWTVDKAQRLCTKMWQANLLSRSIITLQKQDGFPTWIYDYQLYRG